MTWMKKKIKKYIYNELAMHGTIEGVSVRDALRVQ